MRLTPTRRGVARRGLIMSCAVALVLTGCTSATGGHGEVAGPAGSSGSGTPPASTKGATAPGQSAKFGDCGSKADNSQFPPPADRSGKLEYSCAVVQVPLDYAKPSGSTIPIQLLKVHYTGASGQKPMLINRGGPGAAGVDFAVYQGSVLPLPVLEHYDVVGFDPRGVGASSPVRCYDDRQKDAYNAASPNILTAAGFAQAKALARNFAQACNKKYGSALAQYNTVQTAKDMDRLRQALGQSKLAYLGFSYGTQLGGVYAHLFPSHVGDFVLDGAVDPLTSSITAYADQLQGFELAFDQFAAWCTKQTSCKSIGDPREAVYNILAAARRSPLRSLQAGETRRVTAALADLGVLQALYSQQLWPILGQSIAAAQNGNGAGLLILADQYSERTNGHYTNIADANETISCNDQAPGPSDAAIRATARSWVKRFPLFGLYNAASLFGCQQWQPDRTVSPKPTAKNSATTILVLGNEHDPATPYIGTKHLAQVLGNARVLTWDGEGHTSFGQGSSCVDTAVTSYLDSTTLPPAGKVCPQ